MGGGGGGERDREKERDTQRDKQRDRDGQTDRHRSMRGWQVHIVYSFRLLIPALCERLTWSMSDRWAGSLGKQVISFSLMNYESRGGGGGAQRERERAGRDVH